jgi:hypothetical protein
MSDCLLRDEIDRKFLREARARRTLDPGRGPIDVETLKSLIDHFFGFIRFVFAPAKLLK